jgi:hypothetical protein
MLVRQLTLTEAARLETALAALAEPPPQWVLVFAAPSWFCQPQFHSLFRRAFPSARLSGCSTAGEIGRQGVGNGTCVVTTVAWNGPSPAQAVAEIATMNDSLAAGMQLGRALPPSSGVMVFAPGVNINGSALVEGLTAALPPGITQALTVLLSSIRLKSHL